MFTYKYKQFKGVEDLYQSRILPELELIEHERLAFWPKFYRVMVIIIILVAAITVYLFLRYKSLLIVFLGFFTASIAIGGYYVAGSKSIRGDTKHILMSYICGFIGLGYAPRNELKEPHLDYWQQLYLLPPRIDRMRFEDFIDGDIQGTNVTLCEAKLERKVKTDKGHRWDVVFQGSLMALDFHREFLGTTLVLRDAGFFNAKKKGNMKRIGLGEPRFEKIFEAYGTDQVEGRYLLTPIFMETLTGLEDSVDGKRIRFAFANNKLLIAVEHGNRFEFKNLRQSVTDPKRVQMVIDELEAVLSIIIAVSQPKRLQG